MNGNLEIKWKNCVVWAIWNVEKRTKRINCKKELTHFAIQVIIIHIKINDTVEVKGMFI
jgi:hypothetical protein